MMELSKLLYPVWTVFFQPSAACYILPRTILVNGLVLLLALRYCGIPRRKQVWKRSILRVWLVSLLAGCMGALLSFGLYAFLMPVGFPAEQLTMLPGVALAGAFVYLFDSCAAFNRCELTAEQRHRLCLALALFTAPYTMLLPFDLF